MEIEISTEWVCKIGYFDILGFCRFHKILPGTHNQFIMIIYQSKQTNSKCTRWNFLYYCIIFYHISEHQIDFKKVITYYISKETWLHVYFSLETTIMLEAFDCTKKTCWSGQYHWNSRHWGVANFCVRPGGY